MTTGANRPEIGLLDLLQTASDDPAATARFYRDVLGADVESESPAWSQVRLGGVDIGIHAEAGQPRWLAAGVSRGRRRRREGEPRAGRRDDPAGLP